MKLVPRIISIVFVLISISAFADTIRFNLNSNVLIGPNEGAGDNVGVILSGQGVGISALGGTPTFWFDSGQQYFPGEQGLGPTTIFWDTASLNIGSTGYGFDQFDLDPTFLDVPGITFPTNGKNFTVTLPWAWALSGTIISNCPKSGCGFLLVGKPGKLNFSFFFADGVYYASSASFTTVPEPGTFALMVIGIGVVGWRSFRYSCSRLPAGRSV
jgi:PEP-CTERM motif